MNERHRLRLGAITLLLTATLSGCYGGGAEDTAEGTEAITSQSSVATSSQTARFSLVRAGASSCSATIIDRWHVLTAARCRVTAGDHVYFYESPSGVSTLLDRIVDQVRLRPGVVPIADHYVDVNGDFADVALLRLTRPIPESSTPAVMAWQSPPAPSEGARVGAGRHGGLSNPTFRLRTNTDLGMFPAVGGAFFTSHTETNAGDEGGPFYRGGHASLLGVFSSAVGARDKYTSVARHLPWVLDAIDYGGPFVIDGLVGVPTNATSGFVTPSSAVCAYACDNTAGCTHFVWTPVPTGPDHHSCYLLDAPPQSVTPLYGARHGTHS